jgi:hypothetical protein
MPECSAGCWRVWEAMPQTLREKAKAKREMAARVRQMAEALALDDDKARIVRQAEALESEAALLEGRLAPHSDD